jgi:hypothetical protein
MDGYLGTLQPRKFQDPRQQSRTGTTGGLWGKLRGLVVPGIKLDVAYYNDFLKSASTNGN